VGRCLENWSKKDAKSVRLTLRRVKKKRSCDAGEKGKAEKGDNGGGEISSKRKEFENGEGFGGKRPKEWGRLGGGLQTGQFDQLSNRNHQTHGGESNKNGGVKGKKKA